MICPSCNSNTISFFRLWLKCGFGVYQCQQCNSKVKVKSNFLLFLFSLSLGIAAIFIGAYARSFLVLIIAFTLAVILDAIIGLRFRKLIVVNHDSYQYVYLRFIIEVLITIMFGLFALFAKVAYSLMYTNILFFNLFDLFIYGIIGFLIGFLSRSRIYLLTLIFIIPSIIFIGRILVKVYVTGESNYPSHEWIASIVLIPLISFLGCSFGKRLISRKQARSG